MENETKKRNIKRARRQMRVRKRVRGGTDKPRLCINKSNKHLSAQIIDDESHKTLVGLGTMSKLFQNGDIKAKSKEGARWLGTKLAELAKEKNIKTVVFDRGRFKYHGLIAELAQAARESGLEF